MLACLLAVTVCRGNVAFAAGSAKLDNDSGYVIPVTHYSVAVEGNVGSTTRDPLGSFGEARRTVYTFMDGQKQLHVAGFSDSVLCVRVYDSSFQVKKQFMLTARYPLFGGITCDEKGNLSGSE